MDKEVEAILKLQLRGGQATPAPPVGPALGQHEVNIGQFVTQFNRRTQSSDKCGAMLSVKITIYTDKSFAFDVGQPSTTYLLKQFAKTYKGSARPKKETAGFITPEQLEEIAEIKLPDLNTRSLEAAKKIIAGTARSMGIEIRRHRFAD